MSETQQERWAPASGIAYVLLLVVANVTTFDYPALRATPEEFVTYYADNRGLLIAAFLSYAMAAGFFLWFAAAVATRIRTLAQTQLSAIVLGSGSAYAAAAFVNAGVGFSVLHVEPGAQAATEPMFIKGREAVVGAIFSTSFVALTVFVLAVGIAVLRAGLLARWVGYASLAVAIVSVLVATTWAEEGFWSPEGGYNVLASLVYLVWVLTVGVLLVRRRPGVVDAATHDDVQRATSA